MDISISYPKVKLTGFITILIKDQDDVDEFNENSPEILSDYASDNNMLEPRERLHRMVPSIVAEDNGTYGFWDFSGDANGGTGLSFPFQVQVASDNYMRILARQL